MLQNQNSQYKIKKLKYLLLKSNAITKNFTQCKHYNIQTVEMTRWRNLYHIFKLYKMHYKFSVSYVQKIKLTYFYLLILILKT